MDRLNDFQVELDSQTAIVYYIEYQFEKELNRANRYLNLDIKQNLYDNNIDYMKMINSSCDEFLDKNSILYIKPRKLPTIAKNVDVLEPIGEIIDYCIEVLEQGEDIEVNKLKDELSKIDEEYYHFNNFTEKQLEEMITSASIIKDNRVNFKLAEQDEIINSLKTSIKLVDNSSSSNIYRQSFINIFSIFDAYVFEYIEKYFCSKPAELNKFLEIKNSEKVKMTLDEVVEFRSIDNLKNEMIHKQIASKYLRELINQIRKYRPSVLNGIEYPMLVEMIERRNIHLHNKGFVDKKYCDSFNVYNFNEGEYAFIDKEYLFSKVFNILSQFVANMEKEMAIKKY